MCRFFFDIVFAQNHAFSGSVHRMTTSEQNASQFYVRISDWADRMCTRKQLNDCDKENNLLFCSHYSNANHSLGEWENKRNSHCHHCQLVCFLFSCFGCTSFGSAHWRGIQKFLFCVLLQCHHINLQNENGIKTANLSDGCLTVIVK